MIRITPKGNPGPLKEVITMKLYLIIKAICEKILASARRDRGASGPLAGRCDANAPATLLLATAVVCSNCALGGHKVTGSRPVRRACTMRTPWLTQTARRVKFVSPLSAHSAHWGWRCTPLPPSRGQETTSVEVLRTKGSYIRSFRLSATHRTQRCNAS